MTEGFHMSKEQTDFAGLVSQRDIDREWNALCEREDRTSPEEYPDHCLITKSELHAIVASFIAALPSPSPAGGVQGVTDWGDPDDCESVLHALDIAGMATPYNDYQGQLYCHRPYSPDGYRDAEFRDYGLARAVRILCNHAKRIKSALSSQAQTTGGVE